MWSWKPHQNHRKVNQESAAQLSSAGHLHCVSTVQCLRIRAPSHGHSAGLTFTQSVVFILIPVSLFICFILKRKRGGHWLSSRAQTCCGHPVRPFTFFSVPKDSCRPSVCDTKNTPNYHHQQQQQRQRQQRRQEATNKPQSVWTFSAYYYYISCYSAGETTTEQENVVGHVILAIPQPQNHLSCKMWPQKRFWRSSTNTTTLQLVYYALFNDSSNLPSSALLYKHFTNASFSFVAAFIYNIV